MIKTKTCFHGKQAALVEMSLKKFRMGKITNKNNIVVFVAGQLGFDCHLVSGRSHATECKVEKPTKTENYFRSSEYDRKK